MNEKTCEDATAASLSGSEVCQSLLSNTKGMKLQEFFTILNQVQDLSLKNSTGPPLITAPLKQRIMSVDEVSISSAWRLLVLDENHVNWMVVGLRGDVLAALQTGEKFEHFSSLFKDDSILLGILRVSVCDSDQMNELLKYVLITWVGKKARLFESGKLPFAKRALMSIIRNVTIELEISQEEELLRSTIIRGLARCGWSVPLQEGTSNAAAICDISRSYDGNLDFSVSDRDMVKYRQDLPKRVPKTTTNIQTATTTCLKLIQGPPLNDDIDEDIDSDDDPDPSEADEYPRIGGPLREFEPPMESFGSDIESCYDRNVDLLESEKEGP